MDMRQVVALVILEKDGYHDAIEHADGWHDASLVKYETRYFLRDNWARVSLNSKTVSLLSG